MLKSLKLRNFQKHSSLEVRFSPTITTIIGDTDAGKSSVLRALRWICLNQPQGIGFRKIGTTEVSGILEIDDHVIERFRDDTENVYRLDGRDLYSFNTYVPDPIAKILNVGGINFQGQHDAPYWFSLSAGDVSRELNSVVDLDIIDRSLANTAKHLTACRQDRETRRADLKTARAARDSLKWVGDAEAAFVSLKRKKSRLDELTKKQAELQEIIAAHKEATAKLDVYRKFVVAAREVGLKGRRAIQLQERSEQLGELLAEIRKCQKIASMKVPDLSRLEFLKARYEELSQKSKLLSTTLSEIRKLQASKQRLVEELVGIQSQLEEFKLCPTCGNPV